jgi:nucleotide-binding universal stress UspA family protein
VNETPRISLAPREAVAVESREPENETAPVISKSSGPRHTTKAGTQPIWIKHILAPTDLSKDSRGSVNYAMSLALRFQARLTLLYIFRMPKGSESGSIISKSEEIQESRDHAELRLLKFYDVIRAQYPNTEVLFRTGDPDTDIPQIAAFLGVDLVVVGNGRRVS